MALLREQIRRAIAPFARTITFLKDEKTERCKGYLNPVLSKGAQSAAQEAGREEQRRWLLITAEQAGFHLKAGMCFETAGNFEKERYYLEKTQVFTCKGEALYLRGIAVKVGEAQ